MHCIHLKKLMNLITKSLVSLYLFCPHHLHSYLMEDKDEDCSSSNNRSSSHGGGEVEGSFLSEYFSRAKLVVLVSITVALLLLPLVLPSLPPPPMVVLLLPICLLSLLFILAFMPSDKLLPLSNEMW
ncbi:protein AUXIN-REGULATED GENE INVOLVED IN ORGAN SIZE-like [Zingiber officinale]|uniref:protein AUXIN-REGULATED GENE INVOLVED IN ORGAN SIZE-like n=1 Tax=Zingiber officinale TaxID=94328 RepID=UPI001C4BE143|nr:protein AUXIN-REGULATED GENE INVOLVED IN ORGAN SIZE-like [Zingiber officinale]